MNKWAAKEPCQVGVPHTAQEYTNDICGYVHVTGYMDPVSVCH
jgi:hypothetical protein